MGEKKKKKYNLNIFQQFPALSCENMKKKKHFFFSSVSTLCFLQTFSKLGSPAPYFKPLTVSSVQTAFSHRFSVPLGE